MYVVKGEVLASDFQYKPNNHTHIKFEGCEHQYSDFSIGIMDNDKVKLTMESKLQNITLPKPYAKQPKVIVKDFTSSFLSKGMQIDVKCKHTFPCILTKGELFKQV